MHLSVHKQSGMNLTRPMPDVCAGTRNSTQINAANTSLKLTLNTAADLWVHYSHNLGFSIKTSKMRKLHVFILRNFFENQSRTIIYKICIRPIVEYCPFLF